MLFVSPAVDAAYPGALVAVPRGQVIRPFEKMYGLDLTRAASNRPVREIR